MAGTQTSMMRRWVPAGRAGALQAG